MVLVTGDPLKMTHTMVIGKKIRNTVSVHSRVPKGRNTRVNGMKIIIMVKVNGAMWMASGTKEVTTLTCFTAKVTTFWLMATGMLVNLRNRRGMVKDIGTLCRERTTRESGSS